MGSVDIDVSKEEEIFSFLMSLDKFIFEKKIDLSLIVVKYNGREFLLLKIFIGIVDVKQFLFLMVYIKF